jgi:iron complex outermembrane recepter protein
VTALNTFLNRARWKPTALAAACAVLAAAAHAQTTPAPKPDDKSPQQQDKIVVTGIRAALERSIDAKRNADTNVEVVSAEDVGKMPDKNIADALSRLSGVNVQYGGALAMDEAERVSIRGTSPNLNLTTVNGHALSSGDWHVGDQGSSGRSVGFGMLPSQLIGRAVVYKNPQANITEGGIAGAVDIQLRRPLDLKRGITGELSVGVVHATLPGKTDPQISGLLNWVNPAGDMGFLLQVFREDRHLRRDGQEVFSYGVISAAQATASGDPNLAGKRMPGSLNSALFEGKREREGLFFGAQFRPIKDLDLNFQAFKATLLADNYNTSAYAVPTQLVANGWLIRNATFNGDVISSANIVRPANAPATQRVVGMQYDQIVRQGAKSLSSFYDFDAKWKLSPKLTFTGRIGTTEGSGKTNSQPHMVFGVLNPNVSYQINGNRPTDYRLTNPTTGAAIDLRNPANWVQITGAAAAVDSEDREDYLHLDGNYTLDWGPLTTLKFGYRKAKHERQYDVVSPRINAQDNGNTIVTPSPLVGISGGSLWGNLLAPGAVPAPGSAYPSGWASGINGDFPRDLFRHTDAQVRAFTDQFLNWDPVRNRNLTAGYNVQETNQAAYLMTDFVASDSVSGNFGVRAVQTKVRSLSYQNLSPTCVAMQPCAVPGAIVGSRFGTYLPQVVETSHSTALPSLNLRWDVRPDMIARFGASRSLGRPNYNELAGAVALNNALLTGSSGNPNLRPITSSNLDASLGWYFSKRGYVSGSVFQQNLRDYVKTGTSLVEFFNTQTNANALYTVSSRYGVRAKVSGLELAGELPIGAGFGVGANYTHAKGKDQDGTPMLGTSKHTYNLVGFYENNQFSARVAYNYRSDYPTGFLGNGTLVGVGNGVRWYKGYGAVAASVGYKFNEVFSVTLDGTNLNNPVRQTYDISRNAPTFWHQSGRQFFINLRAKI